MKKLFSLLLPLLSMPVHACSINVAYSDVASTPYYLGEGELMPKNPGIAVELVNMAADKIKCKVNWQRMPNRRVQLEMQRGSVDAMLLFSFNAERLGYAVYPMKNDTPDPALRLAALTYRIYVRNDSPLQWDGQKFSQLNGPIGVNAGYSVAQEISKLGATVDEATGTINNIKKLQMGRIAAYVMQDLPADAMIEEMEVIDVRKLTIPISTKDYYLPFSKDFYAKYPDIANSLWKEIATLRRTKGKELIAKYGKLS
jgi:polar amino acid transport system substrate-binding protein